MSDAAIVDLRPAFRALCAKLREFRAMMSFSVDHLGFEVAMMESSREGALQFVVLFSDAGGNEVRMIWSAVGDDEVALAVRGGRGGRNLGAYQLSALVGTGLRDLVDGAIADAIGRVETFAARRASPSYRKTFRTEGAGA